MIRHYIISCCFLLLISGSAISQTFDFISIGPGYNGQVYYSMQNGEVNSISNTDWHLAFQVDGSEASVRINGKNDVRLFRSGYPATDWSNLSPFDTVNVLNSTNELLNSDTSWWYGAFNMGYDSTNVFDLGWGVYDNSTQVVTGDSVYFLMMPGGSVKKVWIEDLTNGVYTFRHADVDGANEVIATLDKANFQGKNFGYYSISSNTTIDREPSKYDWDLVFNQYMAVTPITYKVTGVLANESVFTAKAYPVEYSNADPWAQPLGGHINNIGYDWKFFDLNTFSWVIADSTVYFVKDQSGQIWKLMFTGFGGSANGDYEFVKDPVSLTSVGDNDIPQILSIYPNPAASFIRMVVNSNATSQTEVQIHDLTGKILYKEVVRMHDGLMHVDIDVSALQPGQYLLSVHGIEGSSHRLLQIVR
jgi:hypothetical protein